ncbi:hypothetical protein SeMB42_g03050 [Synchytrium endobioticum]|uniref:protein xylosyltransferase n=1 Tax=Synchytrium endobioticum TaxID=286115 RepID=A0A507DAD4_9FUNG|nr:hypothetical protein SeLEV6574_g02416 [Synchytrium endobioticum]TPX48310.1 hypothetical protein SeMB42_g03050 [Synchytrium endobioticum]
MALLPALVISTDRSPFLRKLQLPATSNPKANSTRIWLVRHTSCLRYAMIVSLAALIVLSIWMTQSPAGQPIIYADAGQKSLYSQSKNGDLILKIPMSQNDTKRRDEPIFHTDLSKALSKIEEVELTGFKYCPWLEGATVNPWINLQPMGGNMFQTNPSRGHVASMVDALAKIVANNVATWTKPTLSQEAIQRFSCRMSIDGTNEWALLADSKWLKHINAAAYFPEMSFGTKSTLDVVTSPLSAIPSSSSQPIGIKAAHPPRKKYKMAYLVMIHEHPDALAKLLSALYSPSTLILVHLDKGSSELRPAVEQVIAEKPEYYNNVHVFSQFHIHWGGGSMVMMMLEGFLKLLDLGDWDYAVNLSGYDYPLLSGDAVHSILERDPGKVYLTHWHDSESARRLDLVFLASADQHFVVRPNAGPDRSFPFKTTFNPIKHHQWLILPRDYVMYLRTSQDAVDLLGWAEHAWVPDEWYFGMLAMSSPHWRDRINTRCGRYINFPHNALHPNWIEKRDLAKIARAGLGSYFFARKVWIVGDDRVTKWMDRWREQGNALVESGKWFGSIAGEPMALSDVPTLESDNISNGVNDVDILSEEWWQQQFVVDGNSRHHPGISNDGSISGKTSQQSQLQH